MKKFMDENGSALRDEELEKLRISGGWTEDQLTPEERDRYHRLEAAYESGFDDGTTSYCALMDFIQEMHDKYGG